MSQSEQANTTMCPSTTSCNIPVKTVYGRILPKCNATEGKVSYIIMYIVLQMDSLLGKKSIRQLEVKSDQARVEISVSASPNVSCTKQSCITNCIPVSVECLHC